ncbi:EF-hand domain-containing protein [uncultured Algibacter sp.]|uniref:EF-hand domain-containing protein n=1 Tax=uncultured Algibacter sp. TaxID=298659 RepID=UPI002610DB5A|nr:EF-hand domain-containing protein [uncultured Algibacter sp.]
MKSNTFKVLVFGIVLMITNNFYGQSQNQRDRKEPPTFKQLLEEMDANEDGKLSKKEIKGPLKNDFTKIDTDEDGFISKKEFVNAPKPQRTQNKK